MRLTEGGREGEREREGGGARERERERERERHERPRPPNVLSSLSLLYLRGHVCFMRTISASFSSLAVYLFLSPPPSATVHMLFVQIKCLYND